MWKNIKIYGKNRGKTIKYHKKIKSKLDNSKKIYNKIIKDTIVIVKIYYCDSEQFVLALSYRGRRNNRF